MLYIYDSKMKKKVPFQPKNPEHISMYVCGPTVYDTPHIGNARPAVVFDIMSRLLRAIYPKLTYVRNITDVDDKIQNKAEKERTTIEAISQKYTELYHHDIAALGCKEPDIEPKATEHIADMIASIETLIKRGNAYVADGHVLFSQSSYPDHGSLSGREAGSNRAGARIKVADYKKNPEDFILWKPSAESDPGWESPWGRGRPGWHIECTAMIVKHLGLPIDIHGGGGDLLFPHHENEQAQGCCLGLGEVYSRYWVHNGMIAIEDEKMSKSIGNIILVRDLLEQAQGETIRFALMQTHYRQPLVWRDDLLAEAKNCLDRYYRCMLSHQDHPVQPSTWQDVPSTVKEALLDDMNVPLAIKAWQAIIKKLQLAKDLGEILALKKQVMATNAVLGIGQDCPKEWFAKQQTDSISPEEIEQSLAERKQARKDKMFEKADDIRDRLAEKGVMIEDSADGTIWYYKR
tara:strand:+ start:852 stop:2234 length:1383 start_codon:yes stop_codon:yes gene_type:complete